MKKEELIRIGIDVGGTNTDIVAIKGKEVLYGLKSSTTKDVISGVRNGLTQLFEESQINKQHIGVVMIGTTHFVNAIVQRREVEKVATIRLCLPAGASLPPMTGWPEDLDALINGGTFMIDGGHEVDGRPISPINEDQLVDTINQIKQTGVKQICISSIFSPLCADFEKDALKIVEREYPEADVTLSSDIGRLGILERENAAIMNASLKPMAKEVVEAFANALSDVGLDCDYYLTQNDGTLLTSESAAQSPVLTFASGPTNSMRGALFLTGLKDAIVVDVGGTTTDVGALQEGFPRPSTVATEVGEIRTNFRMPDLFSVGLGGGSIVRPQEDGSVTVGPDSVGYQLLQKGHVFGGDTLTTTDIAVALGLVKIGEPEKVAHLDQDLLDKTRAEMTEMMTDAVESMRLSENKIPVIAVGGGSILVPDQISDLKVLKPENYAIANAIGAAIAQVSGEIDRIEMLGDNSREDALDKAKSDAIDAAIKLGAIPSTVRVIDVEDLPLAYLPGNAIRIRIKAVGDLDL